jgi:hypothetical protein
MNHRSTAVEAAVTGTSGEQHLIESEEFQRLFFQGDLKRITPSSKFSFPLNRPDVTRLVRTQRFLRVITKTATTRCCMRLDGKEAGEMSPG